MSLLLNCKIVIWFNYNSSAATYGLFDNPFTGGGGDGAKGSQSERLRAARERLRKKAEKKSKK